MFLPVILLALGAGRSDPPIKLSLNSDYYSSESDMVHVRVRAAQDGYVVILRAGVDGHIRVILPLDPGSDNFVRGGKDYGVRGRGDRDGFPIDNETGTGTVVAAWSSEPFAFDRFVKGDHWDFAVLGAVPNDEDPEQTLVDIVREMAGTNHFDYDVAQYRVGGEGDEGGGYGHTHVAVGFGYGWGYNPWTFGVAFGWGYPYGYGCWSWCYGYGYYPYYGYAGYPFYRPYYPYYPYYRYPYPGSAYPYYLHAGYPYTFKPGGVTGGGMIQPRPRAGLGVAAGFGGTMNGAQPGYRAPGFAPRTRTPTPAGSRRVDPRAEQWDRARQNAGQQHHAPQNRGEQRGNQGKSGGGSHGGQAQPRSREPHQSSRSSDYQSRGDTRSGYQSRSRSFGGWGGFDRRQAPSNSYRGFSGFGGRSSMPSFSGGGFRMGGGGGGGARMSTGGGGGFHGGGGGGGRRH